MKLPLFTGLNEFPSDFDDGLTKGGLYSIRIESAPTRLSLMNHALLTNLARDIRCTLITHLTLEEFLAHSDQHSAERLLAAIEEKKLAVFSMVGDYTKNLFRFGPERFLYELEQFRIANDGFLVIDHADSLFTLEDRAIAATQARAYRQWMRKTGNVGLFVFLHAAGNESHHSYFQGLSDHFSGLAGLYIGRNGLELGIDFWSLQGGVIMAKHLTVKTDGGHLEMTPSLAVNRRHARRPDKKTEPVEKPGNVFEFSEARQNNPTAFPDQDAVIDEPDEAARPEAVQWKYRAIRRRYKDWLYDPRLRHTSAQRKSLAKRISARATPNKNPAGRYQFQDTKIH